MNTIKQKYALIFSGTYANSLIMYVGKFTKQHKEKEKKKKLKVSNVMCVEKFSKLKTE